MYVYQDHFQASKHGRIPLWKKCVKTFNGGAETTLWVCRVPKVSDRDSNKLETLRILFSEYRYVHGLYSLVNSRDSNSEQKEQLDNEKHKS